jgi:WD40 repeat protein
LVSASSDKTVRLWDTSSGSALNVLEGDSGLANAVDFSPDGKLLALAMDNSVELWDTESKSVLQTPHFDDIVQTHSFSGDGKFLQTNVGQLRIDGLLGKVSSTSEPNLRYGVFATEQWVNLGN